jgi:hypothetical protein
MPKNQLKQRTQRNQAHARLYGMNLSSQFPVWEMYGAPIVRDFPREQWREQIEKIHESYRSYIRSRIIHEYGEIAE